MQNNNFIADCVKQPGYWLADTGAESIVVSSRMRLARNLRGASFPGWAGEEETRGIWRKFAEILPRLPQLHDAVALEMSDLSRVDKEVLVERRLISRELADKTAGSGLIARKDESVAIMVNEEDHLRIQCIRPGLGLRELWKLADNIDSAAERHAPYAFSKSLGYLTACPSNVGTGLRASVMLHLPGLSLVNEINPIIKGVNKIGLAVRGMWGEGSEASGNMFQISNQVTLGETEETLINRLEQIVLEISEHERNARARLMQRKDYFVLDHIGRAYGILSNARMLNSAETLDMLSALRLGIELDIVRDWDVAAINRLFMCVQPGHLQKAEGKTLGAEKRDLARARVAREMLAATKKRAGSPLEP